MRPLLRIAVALGALAMAQVAHAYAHPGNSDPDNGGLPRWNTSPVIYRINDQTSAALPNIVDGSDPRTAVNAAFAEWEGESGIDFTLGADTGLSSAGVNNGVNLITFADTSQNRSINGGALAVTTFFFNGSNELVDADITFNPTETWSTLGGPDGTVPIRAVAQHETGHFIGLSHSAVVGSTMFPYAGDYGNISNSATVPDSISGDDRAAANLLYPDPAFGASDGEIHGLVTRNGAEVYGAHVVAEDIDTGLVRASSITLGPNQGANEGRYRITGLTPGRYRVYAEPIDGPASSSNWPGDCDEGGDDFFGCPFDTAFETTFAAGPTCLLPGASMTVNLAVTAGAPGVNVTQLGLGTIHEGGHSFGVSGLPVRIARGTMRAVALRGAGCADAPDAGLTVSDPSIVVDTSRRVIHDATTTLFEVEVPANALPGPRTFYVRLASGEVGACVGCLDVDGPGDELGACANGIDDDGDGLADAADPDCFADQCPGNAAKVLPGQCGCAVPDTDSDCDGFADCVDDCDDDPEVHEASPCGCEGGPLDTDGDTTPDCNDGCPGDPLKVAPGACGCGTPDIDTDADGTANCLDGCPIDPLKASPGACGCGVAGESDADGDGIPACDDNCPLVTNASQDDQDQDGTGDACDGALVRLDRVGLPAAGTAEVSAWLDAPGTCVSSLSFTVGFDDDDLDFTGLTSVHADCIAVPTPAAGSVEVSVECNPGLAQGRVAKLAFAGPAPDPPVTYALEITSASAFDCGSPPASLAVSSEDGAIDAGCVMGDISPDGVGNGVLSLSDYTLGRAKLLSRVAKNSRDLACGDVSPGALTCSRVGAASSWCREGNGDFTLSDVLVMRKLLLGAQILDCATCQLRVARASAPGDLAPLGGNGRVDVGDAVRALRLAVGLEAARSEDEILRADVAPARPGGSGLDAVGDGFVGVADVVLILRASVGLVALEWPERALVVELRDAPPHVAFSAQLMGWPANTVLTWFDAAGCDDFGGSDEIPGGLALTCASEPVVLGGERRLATLRYRAPRPIDGTVLSTRVDVLTPVGEEAGGRLVVGPDGP